MNSTTDSYRSPATVLSATGVLRSLARAVLAASVVASGSVTLAAAATEPTAAPEPKRWNDDALVASYKELAASGGLDAAIRRPVLPSDAPEAAFLEAVAWFAAGNPDHAGFLTLKALDEFVSRQVEGYRGLLEAKVERGQDNDYLRTRTWKLIQKLTLLRDEMSRPAHEGRYPYPAFPRATAAADPWEREHTLGSVEEFTDKVCRASRERPVLVKFGNTNCIQCMLLEMIGSVKTFAETPGHKGVEVYKVWWGFRPDASFAARIKDPARLDALVKAEGVKSSPTFVVYRNGHRYPCGGAFPDGEGADTHLDSCLAQAVGEAPVASVCAAPATASSGGR